MTNREYSHININRGCSGMLTDAEGSGIGTITEFPGIRTNTEYSFIGPNTGYSAKKCKGKVHPRTGHVGPEGE